MLLPIRRSGLIKIELYVHKLWWYVHKSPHTYNQTSKFMIGCATIAQINDVVQSNHEISIISFQ